MALPIIGSACPDLSSALKLERLRSLAEAGISKEMLQETESNYLPLCKRFAVSPWFFERDIPNVARLRQPHHKLVHPGLVLYPYIIPWCGLRLVLTQSGDVRNIPLKKPRGNGEPFAEG